METIQGGQIDFDRVIATPDMMGVVGRLGKVLGPKGLMPNPKLGTVTMDVTKAVTDAKSRPGRVPRREGGHRPRRDRQGELLRGRPQGKFHRVHGCDHSSAKPTGAKGKFVKKLSLSSTMGPGVKVNLEEIAGA